MADEPGFVIAGDFYPMPTAFLLGDPPLVKELTGMLFPAFAEALNDGEMRSDPSVLIGLVGVAVAHKFPTWPPERVVKFVRSIAFDSFELVGPEGETEIPPEQTEPGEKSPSSDANSNGSPEPTAEPSRLNSALPPGSVTGSPDSLLPA